MPLNVTPMRNHMVSEHLAVLFRGSSLLAAQIYHPPPPPAGLPLLTAMPQVRDLKQQRDVADTVNTTLQKPNPKVAGALENRIKVTAPADGMR